MRTIIRFAACIAAVAALSGNSGAQSVDHDYYFSTSVDTFLQRCDADQSWCLSVIAPRVDGDTLRFCVPDDHAAATSAVLQWLRSNRAATMANGTVMGNEYLARGIRSAMGNLWGEKGKNCPYPSSPSGGGDSSDDDPFQF